MLKKSLLAGVAASAALLGTAGVAYAHDNNATCNASESTKQSNDDGLANGNANVTRDTVGLLNPQIDKVPAACPTVGNGNGFDGDNDDD